MKKNFTLLVVLLLCRHLLPAQRIHEYTYEYAGFTWFNYSCTGLDGSSCRDKEDKVKTEYPPWIIGGGWRTYFLIDGIGTTVASSPASIVNSGVIDFHTNGGDPVRVTEPSWCYNSQGYYDQYEPWRLQYYCAYSAQYITHPTAGTVSLGFVEGESWNSPGIGGPVTNCTSEKQWEAHSSYVCGSWIPNTLSTNWGQQYFPNNMGPIVWPSAGYFDGGGYKTSKGCANNASIQADDGYLYVFYKDQSHSDYGAQLGPGRQPGIKVARAPISDALNPQAYRCFYEDASGIHWNESLPAGVNKNNVNSFLRGYPGPQASQIIGFGAEADRDYTRFAVAKVAGKNYYLGVGSYQQNGSIMVTLKYSLDLLHWFDDRVIYSSGTHAANKFTYPIFLSADGWTNTSIDENNFYIVGTTPNPNIGNAVHKLHVYIEPPPVCYDQWGNPISCLPPICYDEWGNQVLCPMDLARKETTGAAAALDNSKGRAPFVFPNPGPGTYRLSYTLKGNAKTQLNVLDLMGRQIQTGTAVNRPAGTYTETVNINGYAKGVYMLELLVNGKKQTFKVIYQ